jgi:hypothetical protein
MIAVLLKDTCEWKAITSLNRYTMHRLDHTKSMKDFTVKSSKWNKNAAFKTAISPINPLRLNQVQLTAIDLMQ